MPPYSYWVVLNGLSRGVNFSLFTLLICWSMNSLFPGFSMFLWCVMLSSKVDFFLGRISWARSRFTARFLVYFLFFSSISSPWSEISCTVLSQKVKWSYILAPSGREVKFTQPSSWLVAEDCTLLNNLNSVRGWYCATALSGAEKDQPLKQFLFNRVR